MIMKVFIDTNVFLDYILSRQVGFVEANEFSLELTALSLEMPRISRSQR